MKYDLYEIVFIRRAIFKIEGQTDCSEAIDDWPHINNEDNCVGQLCYINEKRNLNYAFNYMQLI